VEFTKLRKQTRSILDELSSLTVGKNSGLVLESRANHIINSAINLINQIRENYDTPEAEELERRLLNSIRTQEPQKFVRGLRKINESR
jgi:hypothetical protein